MLSGNNRVWLVTFLVGAVLSIVIPVVLGWLGAQVVMSFIGYVAFVTVVAVIAIGARETHEHSGAAQESHAVQAWKERLQSSSKAGEN
jgi:uncharacterized membrane protein